MNRNFDKLITVLNNLMETLTAQSVHCFKIIGIRIGLDRRRYINFEAWLGLKLENNGLPTEVAALEYWKVKTTGNK